MFAAISECASLPWTTGGKHIFLPPQYFNLNWLSLSTFLFIFNNPHHKPTGVINSQCHLPLPNTWMQRVPFRFLILPHRPLHLQVKVDPWFPKVFQVVPLETKYYNYCQWKVYRLYVPLCCYLQILGTFIIYLQPAVLGTWENAVHLSHTAAQQNIINYVLQYVLLFSVKSHLSVSHHSAAEFE